MKRSRSKSAEKSRCDEDMCALLNEVLPLLSYPCRMDQSNAPQNRKNRRSNVLMSASLELSGTSLPVKLRNLSAEGALVEGEKLPIEGASILFRKGDLSMTFRETCCVYATARPGTVFQRPPVS